MYLSKKDLINTSRIKRLNLINSITGIKPANLIGTISKDVIYKGEKTSLFADKVEINLTTKDTKIFMDDKNKKVLVKGTK